MINQNTIDFVFLKTDLFGKTSDVLDAVSSIDGISKQIVELQPEQMGDADWMLLWVLLCELRKWLLSNHSFYNGGNLMKKIILILSSVWLSVGVANASQPLVDVEWVKANIGKPEVVFLDVRGGIAGKSKTDYLRAHIPGAVYTDYLKDGWRSKDAGGTPGQLSPVPQLETLIGGLGIGNDTHVVIVPNGGKAVDVGTGTRIYWTFKVLGHENVSLLNGGMNAYIKEVDESTKKPINPLEKGAADVAAKTFKANLQEDMLVTKEDVVAAQKAGTLIVDHRPNSQFMGINKHGKAKRSGTIPGAVNLPENWLTENGGGAFRKVSAMEKLFEAANVGTDVEQINFCNSGHWASLGWFASHEIMGNKGAKMYDGSMLEWSADESLPIEQKISLD